jgi:muramoyltetrapeptide carboxypeptidase LdcA involved in peptidoglycan recycling
VSNLEVTVLKNGVGENPKEKRNPYSSFADERVPSPVGYLAGPDEDRAADVMTMWKDNSIKMIIANRGGYGCARILELVTINIIQFDWVEKHIIYHLIRVENI